MNKEFKNKKSFIRQIQIVSHHI